MNEITPEKLLSDILDHGHESAERQESFSELEELLLQSEDARKRYLDSVDLHYLLQRELNVEKVVLGQSKVVPIGRFLSRQKTKSIRLACAAAAALVIMGWLTLSVFYHEPKPPALTLQSSPGTQWTVTHDSDSDTLTDSVLIPGSRLQVAQGVVELQFQSGVRSIITGPADLTLNEDNEVFLMKGTGWFHVPKGAEGFRVATPNMKAVDLGTKFGIISNPDYLDELHVFKGAVELTTLKGRSQTIQVNAGEAWIIRPQGPQTTDLSPENFVTSLPTQPLYLHWSFDEHHGDQVQTEGNHPLADSIQATLHQNETSAIEQRFIPGHLGQGLNFDGKGDSVITDWKGISMNAPRTTAFWAKLSKDNRLYDTGTVAWGMRLPGQETQNTKWNIQIAKKRGGRSNQLIANCTFGGLWLEGSTPLNDDTWHHICVTYSGKVDSNGKPDVAIYIDGQLEKSNWTYNKPLDMDSDNAVSVHTETTHPNSMPLIMGSTIHENPKSRHYFKGQLDEVYVFFRQLNQDEVLRLFSDDIAP